MHKSTVSFCVFFTFLLAFTLGILTFSPVHAAVPVKIVGDDVTQKEINKKNEELHKKLLEDRRLDSEQRANETAEQTGMQQRTHDATNMVNRETAQQQSMDDTAKRYMNAAEAACVEGTAMMGQAAALETSLKMYKKYTEANMAITNAEEGTPAANGRIDFNVQLYDQERKGLCSSKGNGGNETGCSGSDSNYLDVATLLGNTNIAAGDENDKKLGYMQKILYARVFSNINPELLRQPSTEIKNIIIEQDRLKSAQGVSMTAFHHLRAQRAPSEGGAGAKQWMQELLQQNNFSSEAINDLLGTAPSYEAQLDYIGRRIYMSPKWAMDVATDSPENATRHIPLYLGWNNMLLFEIYKMLQIIALNTGQAVAQDISVDFENLESRIRAINARQ